MSYRERIENSQNGSHFQHIATKILKEMTELRASAEESKSAPRRWVWELIQNAKDVTWHENGGTNITIELKSSNGKSFLKFWHDGKPFSADNIRYLIEQVSSKDRSTDETGKSTSTGRFGTGFLATHLLSEKVLVRGLIKEKNLPIKRFSVTLDRSGETLEEIKDSVRSATKTILDVDDLDDFEEYDPTELNTSFSYALSDELSLDTAKAGIEDLKFCLPYSFIFVEDLSSVYLGNEDLLFFMKERNTADGIQINTVSIEYGEDVEKYNYAVISEGHTTLAVPVNIDGDRIELLPLDERIPRLFCDFPLIGSESFSFPAIINNPNFNPTDPRDGVFLNSTEQRPNKAADENKRIIEQAVRLHTRLLDYAISEKWENLHLLAMIFAPKRDEKWLNTKWYNDSVLKPIRNRLLEANIVVNAEDKLKPIIKEGNKYIWFPSDPKKDTRNKIWQLADMWFPSQLPRRSDVELWHALSWEECGKLTLEQFATFLAKQETLTKFQFSLDKVDFNSATDWLNSFYGLLINNEGEYHALLDRKAVIPAQDGSFRLRSQISCEKGKIKEIFKDILEGFGQPIREKLSHPEIEMDYGDRTIDQADVVAMISAHVMEKTNTRESKQKYRAPLNQLLLFFRENSSLSEKLFTGIYGQKHILYDEEDVMENIAKAEQLEDLLKEFNVETANELRTKLTSPDEQQSQLLRITQEILANLGISNIDEWNAALEDMDFKAMFDHKSVPTQDMFVFAQSHISRAKQRVISHLKTLEEYDLTHMELTATTVLGGILKQGQEISIVFRPAYDNHVIIYYGSERNTLAYSPSELWVDNGNEIRNITLGQLIISAQIKKFPI